MHFLYIHFLLRFPLVYLQLVSNTTYMLQYYTSSKSVELRCKKSHFIPNQNTLTYVVQIYFATNF